MNINCKWCGRKVPREGAKQRDYQTATGGYSDWYPNPRAGLPAVSSSMGALDPDGLFCTMRCAVRFAVMAVKESERTP